MIHDPTFHNRGIYVEGRFFGAEFELARSFAHALSSEYQRAVKVWFNSPGEQPSASAICEVAATQA